MKLEKLTGNIIASMSQTGDKARSRGATRGGDFGSAKADPKYNPYPLTDADAPRNWSTKGTDQREASLLTKKNHPPPQLLRWVGD